MNGFPISIPLQHKNARAFRIDRIIFDDNRIEDAGEYFTHGQRIFRQFIIPVVGNNQFTVLDKPQNFFEGIGHMAFIYPDFLASVEINGFSCKINTYGRSLQASEPLRKPAQGRVDPLAGDVPPGQRLGVQERGEGHNAARCAREFNGSTSTAGAGPTGKRVNVLDNREPCGDGEGRFEAVILISGSRNGTGC